MDKNSLDLTSLFQSCSSYQMKLLFHQLIHVSLASSIAAIIITVILWPVASHQSLLIWMLLVLVISLVRITLLYFFQKKNPVGTDLKPWRISTFALMLIAGMVWGSLAFLYDFNWPAMQQFSLFAVLFIVALGAITAYATILPIYTAYLIVILAPLSLRFIFSGVENYLFYGAGILLLGIFLYSIAKRYNKSVIQEFGQNLQYRKGYQELKSSHDGLSHIIEIKESEEEAAKNVFSRIAKLKPINKDGIKGIVEPVGTFSGDSIYSAMTPDDQCYILFADFSGHGLPAALGSLPVSSAFYAMTAKGLPPEEILKEINVTLRDQLSSAQFCCACFLSLNPDRTTVQIWNMGIPDVFIVKDQGESVISVPSTHIPLGIEDENQIRYKCETIRLSKGNVIFTYSDGVTETRNLDNEFFGKERLEEHLVLNHKDSDLLEIIKAEMDKYSEGVKQEDDISMLEIRC